MLIRVLHVIDVGGYRLEEEIGAGGMGVVYRATRIADGTSVAVKVLHGQVVVGDGEYLRRLRSEAELAGSVAHHGVVRVHEVGGDGETAWLAMDLKPANILLDGERPLVADFGVARPGATVESTLGIGLTGGTGWAHTGTGPEAALLPGSGTVTYMAPEQWRGEQGDARTDVYALVRRRRSRRRGRPTVARGSDHRQTRCHPIRHLATARPDADNHRRNGADHRGRAVDMATMVNGIGHG
ncbi:MAG: protein kinase domain-containing protein [Pseudonocardiaceae bacterium]